MDFAGMPKNVYCRKASRGHDDPRANEHLWLMLGFAGETTASLEGSQMSCVPDYYRGVAGTAGGLCTGDWGRTLLHYRAKDNMQEITPLQRFDKHAHFLDVIEGKTASIADVHCGRNIVHVSEKAIESAVTGQAVAING